MLHRVEAENYYSKCLAKLGTKLSKACKESVGSCADAWKHVALEMEKRAEIHRLGIFSMHHSAIGFSFRYNLFSFTF